jgi:hypothetical protein
LPDFGSANERVAPLCRLGIDTAMTSVSLGYDTSGGGDQMGLAPAVLGTDIRRRTGGPPPDNAIDNRWISDGGPSDKADGWWMSTAS